MQDYYSENSPDALERIFQGPLNWVNLSLIAVNIIIFFVAELFGNTEDVEYMLKIGAAYTPKILEGEWYRLITSIFLHFGVEHLVSNMVLLLFLGDMLEEFVGKWRYILIYLGGGIAGNVLSLFLDIKLGEMAVSAGASGAVFAVIAGIFVVLLKERGRVDTVSVSRVLFVIVLTVCHGFQTTGIDNAAHIGGVLGGAVLTALLYRKRLVSYD